MSKRNIAFVVLAVLIVLSLTAWILRVDAGSAGGVEVGEAAPDFDLPALKEAASQPSGHLRDYRRQVVVVNFWATWCPPCVEEAPSLEKFAEQMRSQGVTVIGVSVDQDQNQLTRFVAGHGLTFPIVRDPYQALSGRYGTHLFPESYVLDRNGRVATKIVGEIDWQDPRIIEFVKDLAHPDERASR